MKFILCSITLLLFGFINSNCISPMFNLKKDISVVNLSVGGGSDLSLAALNIYIDTKEKLLSKAKYELRKIESNYNSYISSGPVTNKDSQKFAKMINEKYAEIKGIEAEISEYKSQLQNKKISDYDPVSFLPGNYEANDILEYLYSTNKENILDLSSIGIELGEDVVSLYSDIASGNTGAFRFTAGTMIANSQDTNKTVSDTKETKRGFTTYGGNFVITGQYPLLFTSDQSNLFYMNFNTRLTTDLPENSIGKSDIPLRFNFGFDIFGNVDLIEDKLRLQMYTQTTFNFVNSELKNQLNFTKNTVFHMTMAAGVVYDNSIRIFFNAQSLSSEPLLRGTDFRVNIQLLK